MDILKTGGVGVSPTLYENILNSEEIDRIIEYSEREKRFVGRVGNKVNYKRKIRYDICMYNTDVLREMDEMIYKRMKTQIDQDFNIDWQYREKWKMGYYDGADKGFYDQHRDTNGMMGHRKISIIIALSDPRDYDGGELHFSELNKSYKLNKGSAVVFKSDEMHGVTPVTSGKRKVIITFGFDKDGLNRKYEQDTMMNEQQFKERYVPF
jgi:predicted 2-oxoglutarate/Fe(II)-dependent dioxygenase YbiX